MRLDKALYGLVQCARLWYEDISTFLKKIGFKQNPFDECVFTTKSNMIVILYVDDYGVFCLENSSVQGSAGAARRPRLETVDRQPQAHPAAVHIKAPGQRDITIRCVRRGRRLGDGELDARGAAQPLQNALFPKHSGTWGSNP